MEAIVRHEWIVEVDGGRDARDGFMREAKKLRAVRVSHGGFDDRSMGMASEIAVSIAGGAGLEFLKWICKTWAGRARIRMRSRPEDWRDIGEDPSQIDNLDTE